MRNKSIKETQDETERLHSSVGQGYHSSTANIFLDLPKNVRKQLLILRKIIVELIQNQKMKKIMNLSHFYHLNLQDIIQNHPFIGAQGPDVTLATNALSTMSFNADLDVVDAPDLRTETQLFSRITKPTSRLVFIFRF